MRRRGLYGAGLLTAVGLALVACGEEKSVLPVSPNSPRASGASPSLSVEGCHPSLDQHVLRLANSPQSASPFYLRNLIADLGRHSEPSSQPRSGEDYIPPPSPLPPYSPIPQVPQPSPSASPSPEAPSSSPSPSPAQSPLPSPPQCQPSGVEVCDGLDNDCIGGSDNGIPSLVQRCGIRSSGYQVGQCVGGTFQFSPCDDPDQLSGLEDYVLAGVLMEPRAATLLRQIMTRSRLCSDRQEDVDVLPSCLARQAPSIRVGENGAVADSHYMLRFSGRVVEALHLITYSPFTVLSDPDVTVSRASGYSLDVAGAPLVQFALPPMEGDCVSLFQNREDCLRPGEELVRNYSLIKRGGSLGRVYLVAQESDITDDPNNTQQLFNLVGLVSQFNANVIELSSLVGATGLIPYVILLAPNIFALQGEGNFNSGLDSFGGLISINYGGEGYFRNVSAGVVGVAAHEYGHTLQRVSPTWDRFYHGAPMIDEGAADALAVYTGKRQWGWLGFPDLPYSAPFSCYQERPINGPHAVGRCVFWNADQAGFFNPDFFRRMFNPTQEFDFSSMYEAFDPSRQRVDEARAVLTDFFTYLLGGEDQRVRAEEFVNGRLFYE